MTNKQRELKDSSHEYLVESLQVLERYTNEVFSMLMTFHPYLGQAMQQISDTAQKAQMAVELKYPVPAIIVPSASIIKPH